MTSEYEKKLTEYQTNAQVMAAPVRESKEEELGSLEQRIRDFQVKAQQSIQTKEQELMQPMLEKANTAIEAVAKENEYSYILDTSAGVVLYFPETDDILPLVKTKLGIQ
jgi:outer membrane protein